MSLRRLGGTGGLILLAVALTGCFLIQASPNPGNLDNKLLGVSCPTASSCTAVGYYYNNGGAVQQTLVETWDGTTWSVVPSPTPTTTFGNSLAGVSCVSTEFCAAVGNVIEMWDGTTWSVVPGGGAGAVTCLSKHFCVAVGGTTVEMWDGKTWSMVPNPTPGGSELEGGLNGVSCVSTSFCVAVGEVVDPATHGLTFSLVEMWDGTTWSAVGSPGAGTFTELSAVSCISTSSCTAAGRYSNFGPWKTQILSWDGTTWSVVPSPNGSPTGNNQLSGISCVSNNSCTAVGDYQDPSSVSHTLAETFNGTTWSVVPAADSSPSDTNVLNGVACPPAGSGTCTAVGFSQPGGNGPTHTLILHDMPIQ